MMKNLSVRSVVPRSLGIGLVLALVGSVVQGAEASASTLGGTATIASPSGTPLASGGSTTEFTVTLPANAACDGDTASDGYHIWSYLVPQGTSITGLTFPDSEPSEGLGLFDSSGDYYGPANTAIGTGAVTGATPPIPNNFEWAPLITSGDVTAAQLAGTWEGGLLCTNNSGVVSDYWVTQITFTQVPVGTGAGQDPNGLTWTDTPGVPPLTPEARWAVILPLAGVGILGVGFVANRRRQARRLTTTSTKT